ncbi:N-acetyllactosaminide beta-1,3-N-acetylglucosaminyltransferase 3-like [Crotalus tigris]|uniref:N-acetyllactosaminide beta-1,3-N-acetylglucosaminyltransferase 3-like n=1 Tax=Crotalus tigris TaxID=88082 RepID=UPI00192F3C99|nr:N-acetyllactosaminide beta-1,3-N-acetylglucosaminyltransferase 3-like [Crotalus tigris]
MELFPFPRRRFLAPMPPPGLCWACQLGGLALGSLTPVLLLLSWHREQLVPSSPAATLSSRTISALTDGSFTFRFNRSAYEAHFPHLQFYRCQEVIPPDDVCQGPSVPPLLLLAIKSHPASSGRRATLRRTWARPVELGGFRLQPLFLLGSTSNQKHLELVAQESRMFGDILRWDFLESHHNLSLKERCFLRWVHGHCQQAAFVFKGDDDFFVNPKVLTDYLRRTPNASHFIHGNIQVHSTVMRGGKYAVPWDLYPLDRYPNFASGGGFIMSRVGLAALYRASLELPVFPLDDIYLAFLTLAAKIPQRHDGAFRVWGIPTDELSAYRRSVCIHGVSMKRIEEVWKQLERTPEDPRTPS